MRISCWQESCPAQCCPLTNNAAEIGERARASYVSDNEFLPRQYPYLITSVSLIQFETGVPSSMINFFLLQKDSRVCAQLFCFDSSSGYCVSYRPAAEGSPCGDGQVCKNGKCIQEIENIIPDYSQVSASVASPANR